MDAALADYRRISLDTMPRLTSFRTLRSAPLIALLTLAGCYESNALEGDVRGEPDGGIIYVDGGILCEGVVCALGAECCPSCPGAPSFCGDPALGCPVALCLPDGGAPPLVCADGTACGSDMQCCPGCDGHSICTPADEMCLPTPCPPPRSCEAVSGAGCFPDEYCDYGGTSALCGILGGASGICKARPFGCVDIYMPVCGCDAMEYGNGCEAQAAGVDIAFEGGCPVLPPIPIPAP